MEPVETTQIEQLEQQLTEVTAEDTMAEAARKAILKDFIQILKHEDGSREGEDPIHVHDMRVATRRTRSLLQLLAAYFKPRTVTDLRGRLKRVADVLGEVRDLDVMLEKLEDYQKTLSEEDQAAIQPVLTDLDEKRQDAQKDVKKALSKKSYREFVKELNTFATTKGAGADESKDPAESQVRYRLPVEVYEHLATLRAFENGIAEANAERLHDLRIEFKRLRYLVAIFEPLLGTPGRDFIKGLKKIQDHLGEMNDAVVAQQTLTPLLADLDEAGAAVLQRYIDEQKAREAELQASFPDAWDHFNTRTVQRQLATAIAGL